MCEIAIGTDTGGSCRIPASFCGIAGYKPTARLVPTAGAFPLSRTLDSIGPLARSVADCAATHAVLAGDEDPFPLADIGIAGLRLGVLVGPLLADLDEVAGRAFEAALKRLGAAGARIADCRTTLIEDIQAANAKGGFSAPEAFALHRPYFDARKADFDQRVWQRIDAGRHMPLADYLDLADARARLAATFDAACAPFDALILPATPNVAPVIAEVDADDRSFFAHNARALRNTAFVNFVDACAISIPMPTGGLPVGLQLVGRHGGDARLFAVARAVETALQG
jgi:aspartyl-tRNA(Asn)/glutamyl-tRNA(Gln) amidotransferase subunit A